MSKIANEQDLNSGKKGNIHDEPLLFEKGRRGRKGFSVPEWDVPESDPGHLFSEDMIRSDIEGFPELSEPEVVRHFTRLSQWNYCVDTGFYPLGSCTMKYNPRINEDVAALPGFSQTHPSQPVETLQGLLETLWELSEALRRLPDSTRSVCSLRRGLTGSSRA